MIQISEQQRVAIGDKASDRILSIERLSGIATSQANELYRLRASFCADAVDRHGWDAIDPERLSEMCDIDSNRSSAMLDLSERINNLAQDIAHQAQALSDELAEVVAKVRQLEADVRRAQARIKEHPLNDPQVRLQVYQMNKGRCFYCEEVLSLDGIAPGLEFNIDHIMPRVSGGPDHLMNYVPACGPCNVSKNASHFLDFIKRKKFPHLKVVGASE